MIQRFKHIEGVYIEKIEGQDRLAFSFSDTTDFYDLIEWAEQGGYQGSVISFYDFSNGNVYTPFTKQKNVVYSKPRYLNGFYYFLQGNYDAQKIVLYRHFPEDLLEAVTKLGLEEVNLYNLNIIGTDIHIISQDDTFQCYYPEKFSFPLGQHESVALIEDGKVYCEVWIEEGWDNEKNCATEHYKYYDKIVIRDYHGTILSEEVGSLCQGTDGVWWIS